MTIHKNLVLNKRHQFAILYRIMRKCTTQKKPHHDQTHSRSEWRIAHCCTCNDAIGATTQHKRGTLAVAFQCESFLYSRFSSHEWMMQKEGISRPQPATPFDIVVDISQNWHLFSSLNWTESNSLNNFCIFLNCPYDWCVCVCVCRSLFLCFSTTFPVHLVWVFLQVLRPSHLALFQCTRVCVRILRLLHFVGNLSVIFLLFLHFYFYLIYSLLYVFDIGPWIYLY